jgi:hypothetical protein
MLAIGTPIEMYTGTFVASHSDDARVGEKLKKEMADKHPANC